MIQKRHLLVALLLYSHFVDAQQFDRKIPDSLLTKNYQYLSNASLKYKDDKKKSLLYVQTWLRKAKSESDFEQEALAYKSILYLSDKTTWTAYADSMLVAAKHESDNVLIGSAYMTKATVYYGQKEHKKALDNFIIADEYISKTNDLYSVYKVKYGIAQTKYYLGFYDEAISLFRECIDFFKEENDRAYLNSLHCLGLCYNRIGNYEWCTLTNQIGIDEGRKLENSEMEPYFIHFEGVNQCCEGKYNEAIKKLTTVLPKIINNKDFSNESVAYYYIGESYWALKQKEKAITYFKKVDAIFDKEKYIRPDIRKSYELLINYYKKKNDTKSQLFYINQLLKVDQVLGQNYKYLLKKIVKEYDTKELLKSKQNIENTMIFRTLIGFSIITLMALAIIYLVYRHFKNKRLFEEIMKRDTSTLRSHEIRNTNISLDNIGKREIVRTIDAENSDKQSTQEISPDIEAGILKKLEKFEQTKKFLEKDMTLYKMALFLNTNTKYVTKVIAKHRGKGSIDYITDLKIDYITEILKTENKYRNYTNKALGEEAGFGSTQNFTRAFKERNGISPTYFIYKLKKSITASDSQ